MFVTRLPKSYLGYKYVWLEQKNGRIRKGKTARRKTHKGAEKDMPRKLGQKATKEILPPLPPKNCTPPSENKAQSIRLS